MSYRFRILLFVAVLLLLGGVVVALRAGSNDVQGGDGGPPLIREALPPAGVRVRVEVLNASGARGLARRATMHLRDYGYDVVGMGNAPEQRDSTLVLLRSGDEDWARRVALAMRRPDATSADIALRPDSSRHLDVTVLIGRDWRPPPGPLRP
jgi:hypothetical protein